MERRQAIIMAYKGNNLSVLKSIKNRELAKSMQTLLGICMGIVADNKINDQEIFFLSTWLTEYSSVTEAWPGNAISDRVKKILNDNLITEEEKQNLLEVLKQFTGNSFRETGSAQHETAVIEYSTNHNPLFDNKLFCFTGEFTTGTRSYCIKITESKGGIIKNSITKDLDYLVIGTMVSQHWKHSSFGLKIQTAIEQREKTGTPYIITEKQWFDSINTN